MFNSAPNALYDLLTACTEDQKLEEEEKKEKEKPKKGEKDDKKDDRNDKVNMGQ